MKEIHFYTNLTNVEQTSEWDLDNMCVDYFTSNKAIENPDEKMVKTTQLCLLRNTWDYIDQGARVFIHNGNEYTTLKQSRLRPGIYSRRKANGELESQFNIKRGTGVGYRVTLEPSTGIYRLNISQSNVPLYSVLHDLGVSDEELKEAWGEDIFNRNKAKYDARSLDKVYSKIVMARNRKPNATREEKIEGLKKAFDDQRVERKILNRNLFNE